jgi:hypothetical protein
MMSSPPCLVRLSTGCGALAATRCCQQRAVRLYVGQAQGKFDWLGQVYAQAPAFDDALLAQPGQCAECAGAGSFQLRQPRIAVKILCGVMHKDEVQSIDPEAIEAALDRFQWTLFRVVIDDTVDPPELKHLGIALVGVDLVQHEPAHLGAQHVVIAVVLGEVLAQAHLSQAGAVHRCRVEKAGAMGQAASTVAAASWSGMSRNMLPNGAVPKPNGPFTNKSLIPT